MKGENGTTRTHRPSPFAFEAKGTIAGVPTSATVDAGLGRAPEREAAVKAVARMDMICIAIGCFVVYNDVVIRTGENVT